MTSILNQKLPFFQWRQLPENEKQVYEERAKKINEENQAKLAGEQRMLEER